ncbi:MAG: hypothetical protein HDS35_06160 [Bacteroides sp.]|nr:hypothetical protein [Bacteroides sp.]
MKNRILVVEDQMDSLRSAFLIANARKFNNELKIVSVPRSQDIAYGELRQNYDVIFIDITLAKKSEKNGFGVIRDILSHDYFPKDKLVILSASNQIKDGLQKNNLPSDIAIMHKPVLFLDLEKKLQEVLS